MLRLDLDPEERELLREMLETAASDLRMEIADTDRQDFRERLKERKQVLAKVLKALEEGSAM